MTHNFKGGEGELPSVGSISDELGNLMNKIQEANAIAKNSEFNFEFGFQASDQLFVKVIRGKKYKAYWEQPYFSRHARNSDKRRNGFYHKTAGDS